MRKSETTSTNILGSYFGYSAPLDEVFTFYGEDPSAPRAGAAYSLRATASGTVNIYNPSPDIMVILSLVGGFPQIYVRCPS